MTEIRIQKKHKAIIGMMLFVATLMYSCKEDIAPPPGCEISLVNDNMGTYFYNDTVKVFASIVNYHAAIDMMYIYVNDKQNLIEEQFTDFEYQVSYSDLKLGENTVDFEAVDINGSIGSAQVKFELLSDEPIVYTDTVIIEDKTATVTGSLLSDGGLESSWGICFSENIEPTISDNKIKVTDKIFTYSIPKDKIEYGKKYYVRSWAENSNGIFYGEIIEFVVFDYGLLIDARDNKEYKTIEIGGLTWMAENLAWEGDGTNVMHIVSYDDWGSSTNGYIYYLNDKETYEQFGVYYQFDAAKNACPSGWHLPSTDEWGILAQSAGGRDLAGIALKSKDGWKDEGDGDDLLGFNILPAGRRDNTGYFSFGDSYSGKYSYFWADEENGIYATSNICSYNDNELYEWTEAVKRNGMNVRCVKD
jgi:uncharacterized protein (TIGR02145 family)